MKNIIYIVIAVVIVVAGVLLALKNNDEVTTPVGDAQGGDTATEAVGANREEGDIDWRGDNSLVDSLRDDSSGSVNPEMSFAHVEPGVSSEVYLSVNGVTPGAVIESTLTGPAVSSAATQVAVADEFGVLHYTWKITQFGMYNSKTKLDDYIMGDGIQVK